MKTMTAKEFAELKDCNISKVQDAIHGRGAQSLDSILVSLKGEGRKGSRQRRIIMNEKAENFIGGKKERKSSLIEVYLQEEKTNWNRPVNAAFY